MTVIERHRNGYRRVLPLTAEDTTQADAALAARIATEVARQVAQALAPVRTKFVESVQTAAEIVARRIADQTARELRTSAEAVAQEATAAVTRAAAAVEQVARATIEHRQTLSDSLKNYAQTLSDWMQGLVEKSSAKAEAALNARIDLVARDAKNSSEVAAAKVTAVISRLDDWLKSLDAYFRKAAESVQAEQQRIQAEQQTILAGIRTAGVESLTQIVGAEISKYQFEQLVRSELRAAVQLALRDALSPAPPLTTPLSSA